jgi:hypothetical protein
VGINAFEGARRLLLTIQVLWVLLAFLIAWSERPPAHALQSGVAARARAPTDVRTNGAVLLLAVPLVILAAAVPAFRAARV